MKMLVTKTGGCDLNCARHAGRHPGGLCPASRHTLPGASESRRRVATEVGQGHYDGNYSSTSIKMIKHRRRTPAARAKPGFVAGSQLEAAGHAPAALRDKQAIGRRRQRSERYSSPVHAFCTTNRMAWVWAVDVLVHR